MSYKALLPKTIVFILTIIIAQNNEQGSGPRLTFGEKENPYHPDFPREVDTSVDQPLPPEEERRYLPTVLSPFSSARLSAGQRMYLKNTTNNHQGQSR